MALLQKDGTSLTAEDLELRQFLTVGRFRLDRYHHIVWLGEERHELTRQEFLLLEVLMQNAPRPVARDVILERAWNLRFDTYTNRLDVYVSYLRRKLGPHTIRTVRGMGYGLTA